MNLEKVVFGFFILLAATLNFGFVYGDMANPELHEPWEFFAAVAVSLVAAVLKFGDRTHVGAVHLASSLVALLQLAAAMVVWVVASPADGQLALCRNRLGRLPRRRRLGRQHRLGRHHGDRDHRPAPLSRAACGRAVLHLDPAPEGAAGLSDRRLLVSTAGLSLIPGVDAAGQTWHPNLFESFYFVTYTATTIGFGELPYTFTNLQRLWVTAIIYLSVIGWAYLLGNILALVQDKGFRAAVVSARFGRTIRHLREPFYLVCGLGETGLAASPAPSMHGAPLRRRRRDEARILELDLGDFATDPPASPPTSPRPRR